MSKINDDQSIIEEKTQFMSEQYDANGHIVFHGEALQTLKNEIADNSVDLIFADPPYNIGKRFGDFHDKWPSDIDYAEWCYQWIDACIQKLKPNGSFYLMTSTQAMPYLDLHIREKMSVLSRIVWSYDSSGVQAKKYYGSMYEPILFCVKDASSYTFNAEAVLVEAKTGAKRKLIDYRKAIPTEYNSKKVPGNVWEFPRVRYRMKEYENHPSQKPESLLERIILASSNAEDVILDPFAGSFSTCAVAKRLGRKSIGIERELEYVKIGLRRVLDLNSIDGLPLTPPEKTFKHKKTPAPKSTRSNGA